MKTEEFHSICQSVASGEKVLVQNLELMYTGEVVACGKNYFVVDAFGHNARWDNGICRPADESVNPLGPPSSVRH